MWCGPCEREWSSEFCGAMEMVAPDQIVRIPRACERAGCWSADAWTLIAAAVTTRRCCGRSRQRAAWWPDRCAEHESQSRGTPWINQKSAGRRSQVALTDPRRVVRRTPRVAETFAVRSSGKPSAD